MSGGGSANSRIPDAVHLEVLPASTCLEDAFTGNVEWSSAGLSDGLVAL